MGQSFRKVDRRLSQDVERKVTELCLDSGIPRDTESLWDLVQELVLLIVFARGRYYKAGVSEMQRQVAVHGMEVVPAPLAEYRPNAAWKLLLRAVGIRPTDMPSGVDPDLVDEVFLELVSAEVGEGNSSEDVELFARKVAASSVRHARAAYRDVFVDTADSNQLLWADTGEAVVVDELPDFNVAHHEAEDARDRTAVVNDDSDLEVEIAGTPEAIDPLPVEEVADEEDDEDDVLGWARVLTGEEDCAFCAMLASRGPVYTKKTALLGTSRSRTRDGLRYHDNCDCESRLVVRGESWDGEEQYDALEQLWIDARDAPTEEELELGLNAPAQRFAHRYSAVVADDPSAFAVVDTSAED